MNLTSKEEEIDFVKRYAAERRIPAGAGIMNQFFRLYPRASDGVLRRPPGGPVNLIKAEQDRHFRHTHRLDHRAVPKDMSMLAREMNLRTAEDFIEMASLLIFIKSRMLLPTDGEDPREELVEKIIEYEKIRAMAKSLDRLPVLGRDTFAREHGVTQGEEGEICSPCARSFYSS